jgi:hypothetical protein
LSELKTNVVLGTFSILYEPTKYFSFTLHDVKNIIGTKSINRVLVNKVLSVMMQEGWNLHKIATT